MTMKLNWLMQGTVTNRDGSTVPLSGVWPGLTYEQAEAMIDDILGRNFRKGATYGVQISATGKGGNTTNIITKAQWK